MSIPNPFDFLTCPFVHPWHLVPFPRGSRQGSARTFSASELPLFTPFPRRAISHRGSFGHKILERVSFPMSVLRALLKKERPHPYKMRAILLEGSAPSRTASSPTRASAPQGFGRHGADWSNLERHGPFLKIGRADQTFRFRTSALGARRACFVGARHVFKFMRARTAVKVIHGHKGNLRSGKKDCWCVL